MACQAGELNSQSRKRRLYFSSLDLLMRRKIMADVMVNLCHVVLVRGVIGSETQWLDVCKLAL